MFGLLSFLQDVAITASSVSGFDTQYLKSINLAWILVNWKVKVLSEAFVGDTLNIKTWTNHIKGLNSIRDFEIFKGDKLIAIASSKWILFDIKNLKIMRIPQEMLDKYISYDKFVFEKSTFSRLNDPKEYESSFEYKTLRRDIDTNNHVNNVRYLEYAYETLPKNVYTNMKLLNIEISYKSEILEDDEIICFYSYIDNEHIITIKSKTLDKLHSIIKLY